MSYQVLARKWRPRTFEQLVGQEHVSQALVNGLDQDRLHHAFLLTGTRGIGKTTIARILAKCLNCERGMSSKPCGECGSCVDVDEGRFVDMIEIDAASRTGVDDMRELLETVQYTPTRGRYKVYIIDEVHMLSKHSFNALLKTLEEPPPHVKFVLATTNPENIPVTILSRCLQFNLRRLLPAQIGEYLGTILTSEGIEAEPEAVTALALAADGSMRDGLSLLDQAVAFGGGRLRMSDLEKMLGLVDRRHVAGIVRALAGNDAEGLLGIVAELVAQSRDLEAVLSSLAEMLHRVTLLKCAPGYRDPERADWEIVEELAESLSAPDAQLFYQIALKGRNELPLAPDPRTGLEMTLLRMLAFRPADAPAAAAAGGPAQPPAAGGKGKPRTANEVAAASPGTATSGATPSGAVPPTETSGGDWVTLLDQLELQGQVRELARNVQLQAQGDDRWDFIIAPALRHLGSPACVDRLGAAISERVGRTVRVRIVEEGAGDLFTAADIERQQVQQTLGEAESAVRSDPTIRELQEQMDAQLVEDSIQPLQ